jgi:uncharacterized protein YdiU (UPF0061 family)
MRAKLGLFNTEPDDNELVEEFLACLQTNESDFTNAFRDLSSGVMTDPVLAASGEFRRWHARWQERLSRQSQSAAEVRALMRRSNPAFIPRNHKVEEALTAASVHGDVSVLENLLEVVTRPFDYDVSRPDYSTPPAPGERVYQTFCGT